MMALRVLVELSHPESVSFHPQILRKSHQKRGDIMTSNLAEALDTAQDHAVLRYDIYSTTRPEARTVA